MITWFDPPPRAEELPRVFPSPFATEPHPLARRAAEILVEELRSGGEYAALAEAGQGKMFGVLVVADAGGRVGFLRAFSGMLFGAWQRDGFAPPLFDAAARDAIWPAGQDALREYELALRAHAASPDGDALDAEAAALAARHAAVMDELRARHRARRDARHTARAAGAERHALDQQSRGDAAERRTVEHSLCDERESMDARLAAAHAVRDQLARARADESRRLMTLVHDSYVLANARGERVPLRALFAPGEPAGGAGDCAGPKLLGHAYRLGLAPLALAEVWWGAPPATGGRVHGAYYPSCRGKCGPILPHLLGGVPFADAPAFGAAPRAEELRVIYEDAQLLVVDKPCGLLSVPGRGGALRDCAVARLAARGGAPVYAAHRLDLDTSGLFVAAKDPETHAALQKQFARREVEKRYVALLDGALPAARGAAGTIELPLRVDLDDRPRQIVDDVHGKAAFTEWRVLAREAARTRVALHPRTGRTHQLRVHAAHARGLGVPIVGDRLYGRPAERLLLHAEAIAFAHPRTGARVALDVPAPF